jgi:transposase
MGVQLVTDMASRETNRDEWRRRVERWKDSGLTAKEFAAETGINAGTLQFWKYKLKKREVVARARRRPRSTAAMLVSSLIEVRPSTGAAAETRFEIELGNGRRLRVPAGFEPGVLKTLLAVLEASP